MDIGSYIIQVSSGIICGRVLNGEFYAQRFQKLIYVHVFTDCFVKMFVQVIEENSS